MTICSHLLTKRVRALSSSVYSFSPYQNPLLLTHILRSSLSTQNQTPSQTEKELPFIAQYLISSFGIPPNRALKYSADSHLAPIKSPERPEAVVKFLSDTGLTDAQIKALVSFRPLLLSYNVDKTFKPKVRELINGGCSGELLVQLIRYNPLVLCLNGTLSRLHFWRDFIGNGDEGLLKIIPRLTNLFTLNIDKKIVPLINLLKDHGVSKPDMLVLLRRGNRSMGRNLNSLRRTLELIEELGIPRGSIRFRTALSVLGCISEDTIKRKMGFFKKIYGWSQEDVNSVFSKFPQVVSYSENKVKSNMDFLLGKARFDPRTIVSNPSLIGRSLERVLLPRYIVLRALEDKGMIKKWSLLSACRMSERNFYERYVVPFEKVVPELSKAYVAAMGVLQPKNKKNSQER